DEWVEMVGKAKNPSDGEVVVGIVGKYVAYEDSYKSLNEALTHGGIANNARVRLHWIEADRLVGGGAGIQEAMAPCHGLLVPGGFGLRGVDGMIEAIRFARERRLPFFGICLGMQCAVIDKLRELEGVERMGGNMRLGKWPCLVKPGSHAHKAYGRTEISERHRHRYEVHRKYMDDLERRGLK